MHEESPSRVISDVHAALRPTRGAAVAMVAVDTDRGVANFCGLGNIGAVIVSVRIAARDGFAEWHRGTHGQPASTSSATRFRAIDAGHVLRRSHVALGSRAYPGLGTRHPSVIAGVLYRDFSRRRDDVTVVVAKSR